MQLNLYFFSFRNSQLYFNIFCPNAILFYIPFCVSLRCNFSSTRPQLSIKCRKNLLNQLSLATLCFDSGTFYLLFLGSLFYLTALFWYSLNYFYRISKFTSFSLFILLCNSNICYLLVALLQFRCYFKSWFYFLNFRQSFVQWCNYSAISCLLCYLQLSMVIDRLGLILCLNRLELIVLAVFTLFLLCLLDYFLELLKLILDLQGCASIVFECTFQSKTFRLIQFKSLQSQYLLNGYFLSDVSYSIVI